MGTAIEEGRLPWHATCHRNLSHRTWPPGRWCRGPKSACRSTRPSPRTRPGPWSCWSWDAEDRDFLRSGHQRFGLWFLKAGKGVTHSTHMQRFGIPGKTMVGFDSHTPAAGSLGMLAIGVGGTEVAPAIAGEPLYIRMPEIWGVKLTGQLPPWTSAKDVILEMLRRHGVKGGVSRIVEYYDPGLAAPTAMDRHVIAYMGGELLADEDATYDVMRSATCAPSERKAADQKLLCTAETEGFEPSVPLRVLHLSRVVH